MSKNKVKVKAEDQLEEKVEKFQLSDTQPKSNESFPSKKEFVQMAKEVKKTFGKNENSQIGKLAC